MKNGISSTIPYLSALLMGVVLFVTFGKNLLDLESMAIFLAGLAGVAVAVLAFGLWNIYSNSHHKED